MTSISPNAAIIDCATAYTLEFVRSALPENARRVLEVGCGDGGLAAALARTGFEVVALDSDPEAVDAARDRGVDARQAEWPEFSDGTFDAVLFTRSLHHVRDLHASVAAAFGALGDRGRLIVEDFMAEGEPPRSLVWFRSLARMLHESGLLPRPTEFLAQLLGLSPEPRDHHDHELHSSIAIEAALTVEGAILGRDEAAYYFRYLLPALDERPGIAEALLSHEMDLIAQGLIDPFGRRYVASRHPA